MSRSSLTPPLLSLTEAALQKFSFGADQKTGGTPAPGICLFKRLLLNRLFIPAGTLQKKISPVVLRLA
ncbi:MAG TPA: hypothetical protein VLL74_05805, partial [Methanoregula sp.]|nr:hypothetical protein [Methanoregula sp.]